MDSFIYSYSCSTIIVCGRKLHVRDYSILSSSKGSLTLRYEPEGKFNLCMKHFCSLLLSEFRIFHWGTLETRSNWTSAKFSFSWVEFPPWYSLAHRRLSRPNFHRTNFPVPRGDTISSRQVSLTSSICFAKTDVVNVYSHEEMTATSFKLSFYCESFSYCELNRDTLGLTFPRKVWKAVSTELS